MIKKFENFVNEGKLNRDDDIYDKFDYNDIDWNAIDDNDSTEAEELKQDIEKELDDIDDDYPTNKGKTVEKFNLMKEVVRQYFDKMEMDTKLPGLSNEEIDDYDESDYNSERKQIRRYFGTTLDLNYNNIEALEYRVFSRHNIERGFYYTLEDIKEICNVIIGAFGKGKLVPILKEILDTKRVLDKKLHLAFLRGKKLPLAVAVNGKILAGMAYYNPIFDMFTETEEQMKYLIDKFKKSNVYEILTDYFENLPDVSEYEFVDLKEMNRG